MSSLAKVSPVNYRQSPSLKVSDLHQSFLETKKKFQALIHDNDLTAERGAPDSEHKMLTIEEWLLSSSKSSKKKFAKRIQNVNKKMTIRSFNSLMNFIRNKVFQTSNLIYITILPSAAEKEIAQSREKFKKLRQEMLDAKKEYLQKKSDFKLAGRKYFGN
jgi:hypothetical protein